MKKEEFDKLSSMENYDGNNIACPICGKFTTHPTPGCNCRSEFGYHVMKYHHTCNPDDIDIGEEDD